MELPAVTSRLKGLSCSSHFDLSGWFTGTPSKFCVLFYPLRWPLNFLFVNLFHRSQQFAHDLQQRRWGNGGIKKVTDENFVLRPTDSEVHIFFCGSYIIKYLFVSATVSVSAEQFQVLKAWCFLLSLLTSKVKVSLR